MREGGRICGTLQYLYIVCNFDIKWYTYFTIHSRLMLTCSDVIQIILVIYSEVIVLYSILYV